MSYKLQGQKWPSPSPCQRTARCSSAMWLTQRPREDQLSQCVANIDKTVGVLHTLLRLRVTSQEGLSLGCYHFTSLIIFRQHGLLSGIVKEHKVVGSQTAVPKLSHIDGKGPKFDPVSGALQCEGTFLLVVAVLPMWKTLQLRSYH